MNKIYIEISKLTEEFRKMAFGLTQNEDKINEAVQELMIFFLQMNKVTLLSIWEKDGIEGIKRYGAVVLKRSLTSKYSRFYYKYEKYYKHIDNTNYVTNTTHNECDVSGSSNYYKSLSNIPQQDSESNWKKLELIDCELDKLYWYDKKLFQLYYYEGNTLDSLAKKTRISRNSLFTTIDKVRTILKKELADE